MILLHVVKHDLIFRGAVVSERRNWDLDVGGWIMDKSETALELAIKARTMLPFVTGQQNLFLFLRLFKQYKTLFFFSHCDLQYLTGPREAIHLTAGSLARSFQNEKSVRFIMISNMRQQMMLPNYKSHSFIRYSEPTTTIKMHHRQVYKCRITLDLEGGRVTGHVSTITSHLPNFPPISVTTEKTKTILPKRNVV